MGAGNPQTHGNLTGRVVEDGAGIMMVGPIVQIIIVLAEVIDLVFGLNRAMLSQTDIDSDLIRGLLQ